MGKHVEWRKAAKKYRRKRLRQLKAKNRDFKLEEEKKRLEASPTYKKWIEEQDIIEQQREEEDKRQSAIREKQWREVEQEAQKQWQQLQNTLLLAREEKMKQNMKIKLEWEREQKILKILQMEKEKELEEKRHLQKEHEQQLLDFLEHGGDTPEHLKAPLETNPSRQTCPFFQKVSACRFFDSCSRNHMRPGISKIILITNFFSDISLEAKENEHGSDSSLEFEKEDTYAHYVDFFYDVVSEFEKCGRIRNFFTCCNHESHLRGNVYVEYNTTRDALVSYHKFNGRWYGGRQLNIYFCNIENWKFAICGLFFRNKCPKGNSCNFLHVFKNPKNLYIDYEDGSYRNSRRDKEKTDTTEKREQDWESVSTRHMRWSQSPEPILRKDSTVGVKYKSKRYKNNSASRADCYTTHKERGERDRSRHKNRSRSPTKSRSRKRKRSSRSRRKEKY